MHFLPYDKPKIPIYCLAFYRIIILLLTFSIFGGRYSDAFSQKIDILPWQKLVPSNNLPDNIEVLKSNCNLDAVSFEDQIYLAFRTAPSHFASSKVRLHIIKTSFPTEKWEKDTTIALGNDIREPRFVVFHDTLFLYFFEGGKRWTKFEPQKMWLTFRTKRKGWSPIIRINWDGYVPWRIKVVEGRMLMSAYYGRYLYRKPETAIIRLLESHNGFQWKAISDTPQVALPGAEEGEFIFDSAGKMWGTVRIDGEGAFLARAEKEDLVQWKLSPARDKYDSPLLFSHADSIYLIARRNPDPGFSKPLKWLPKSIRRFYKLIRYSNTPKRTALYLLNREALCFDHILDFESKGDTSYPGVVPIGNGHFLLFNYSSDLNGNDKTWFKGQLSRTYIYWTLMSFSN